MSKSDYHNPGQVLWHHLWSRKREPSQSTRLTSRQLIAIWIIAFTVATLYIVATIGFGSLTTYYYEYDLIASRLLEHGTIVSPLVISDISKAPSNLMPPGYIALVSTAYALFGASTVTAIAFLQCLNCLFFATAVTISAYAAARYRNTLTGWTTAALLILNPLAFGYVGHIWDTSLFLLLVAGGLLFVVVLSESPMSLRRAFSWGIYLGFVALVNPALTICYPWLVLASFQRSRIPRWSVAAKFITMTLLGWLIVVSPWTVRNYIHFQEVSYIRGGLMLELWLGVCPEADNAPNLVYARQFPLPTNEKLRKFVESEGERKYIAACKEAALNSVIENPVRYLRLCMERASDYWLGTVATHVARGESWFPSGWTRRIVCVFTCVETTLLLVGIVMIRRAKSLAFFLYLTLATFSVVYICTHIQVRFRAPIEPISAFLLSILAGCVVDARLQANQDDLRVSANTA